MDLVAGPLERVINKLVQVLKEEYNLQKGVRKKITCLSSDLKSMRVALETVAEVPPEQLNKQVKLWASDVRELAYDVEDIVDCFLVRVEGCEARHTNRFKRAAKKIGKLFSKSKALHQLDAMITIINEQAKELAERRDRYKVGEIIAKPAAPSSVDPRLAALYKEVTQLVGIEESSGELVSMLSLQGEANSTNKNMKIVSVVGAGGLGKTTLAKAVHDKFKVDFECGAFVSVGRNPDLKKVFRDILIELDRNKYVHSSITNLDEKQLIDELREYLRTKRYFIVIDDIWEIKSWQTIKLSLVQNNCGSRLITTTRKLEVANADRDKVYKLKPLPCDKSKKLFYMRMFGAEGKCPDNQMNEVSDKILKKCDGVPLSIITMSSLLLGKSRDQWNEVCHSIALRDRDNRQVSDTEWILSLSYYDLPTHLKTCLLYLSVFSEDHVIDKDSLIWMWVAEGFIQDEPRTRYFEVGKGYFNELINRSMIQPVESKYSFGLIYSCRIHDMVLDLLRAKSHEENFVTILDNDNKGKILSPRRRVRRLADHNRMVVQIHQDNQMDLQYTRTLVAISGAIVNERVSLLSFKYLRVLALENCYLETSLHLENLLHLRYLKLRTEIFEFPTGIGAMKFLQTLDLLSTSPVLPSSIGQLTQLMCLRAWQVVVPNRVIEKLTSLEELEIEFDEQIMGSWQLQELGNLRELRVFRAILYFNDKGMQSDLVKSLCNLHNIQHLNLTGNIPKPDKTIWDAIVLPQQLRFLCMVMFTFPVLPSWINPSDLPNLCNLALEVSEMDEQDLKILGGLPELRYLYLRLSSGVTITFHPADNYFQKLRTLELSRSLVSFVHNEDLSVSFTIWNRQNGPAFGSKARDVCITAPPSIMPDLEALQFFINMQNIIHNNSSYENLGLEYLPSLLKVSVDLWRDVEDEQEVAEAEKVEAALRHTTQIHPNRPTLNIDLWRRSSSPTGVSDAS